MNAIPETMTAAVTERHGGLDAIRVHHDWPVPTPAPGEVLVAVRAAAINTTDVWTREGAYGTASDPSARAAWLGEPLAVPRIQGGDLAGVVTAVGSGVAGTLMGRRVVVDPAIAYDGDRPARILGSEVDGAFAEFASVPADRVHDVSDAPLTDEQLACLPIAYATALGMIDRAGCERGERVLVTAASGGVGLAAVHLLAAMGCDVTALTSAGKEVLVGEAGATDVVLRDSSSGPVSGFDVVVDLVGGPEFGARIESLTDGGRLVTAGAIAGPVTTIDLRRVYLHHRAILGSTMHSPAIFERVVSMARAGTITPRVAETFALADIHAAYEAFARKDFVGKLVVVP